MPGAFDGFEGTQEELDELVKELKKLAKSGKLLELSIPLDEDEFFEDDEDFEIIFTPDDNPRKLN